MWIYDLLNYMITAPDNIRTIEQCFSELIVEKLPFPETPSPPDLCDVILDGGLKIENVYVQINRDKNHKIKAFHLYKNVHPTISAREALRIKDWCEFDPFDPFSLYNQYYIIYIGYNQVATVYTPNCTVIKKITPI